MNGESLIMRALRAAIVPAVAAVLIAFFAWHTLQGSRGLIALGAIKQQIALAEAELSGLEMERTRLERRVGALRPEQLDADALDEQARQMLNVVGRDEIVVLYGPGGRLF